jgi:hypothetical protein
MEVFIKLFVAAYLYDPDTVLEFWNAKTLHLPHAGQTMDLLMSWDNDVDSGKTWKNIAESLVVPDLRATVALVMLCETIRQNYETSGEYLDDVVSVMRVLLLNGANLEHVRTIFKRCKAVADGFLEACFAKLGSNQDSES